MSKKDTFFIGWQPEMDANTKGKLRWFLGALTLVILAVAYVVILKQKPFNSNSFEYGKLTTVSGTYYHHPVPMLVADDGVLPADISNKLVLVGYGKFGAEGIMNSVNTTGQNLNGAQVTLQGSLIYGNGKTLLELTNNEKSVIELTPAKGNEIETSGNSQELISLSGEIIDPKCYFGVMKPGNGKIHKSCAIRCISGGIPPVLRVKNTEEQTEDYYLIVNKKGEQINKQVLKYVAETSELSGRIASVNGWDVLYTNTINKKEIK